jgi:hypothetical protein
MGLRCELCLRILGHLKPKSYKKGIPGVGSIGGFLVALSARGKAFKMRGWPIFRRKECSMRLPRLSSPWMGMGMWMWLSAPAIAFALLLSPGVLSVHAQGDANRLISGGGISVPGWQGKIDSDAARLGQTVKDAKLAPEGKSLHVTTGPAVAYWNPANRASGNYTVSATFTEPKFMNLNDHPHPYGIVIAGNDMGTAQQTYLYCAAYGDGKFIVRGFGPEAFQMNGGGEQNAAVHKAPAVGQPVVQKIAMSVNGGRVECAINGTVVASYNKAQLVGSGKLKSTDGVYGIRFAHNTDAIVSDLSITKP